MTRRGTRIVTGYVVSLSGKKGGPWVVRHASKQMAKVHARLARRNGYPAARVLPVVRYELDREEERLRDAVVEAAIAWESSATPLYLLEAAVKTLEAATLNLRAHLEKSK